MTDPLTTPPAPDAAATGLPEGRLEGRQVFVDLVRQALATAADAGWSRIVLSDADFADWPLGEREVIESLNRWARRGRTLQLLAADFNVLRLNHPRFVQWRVTWGHLVEAQACGSAASADLPSMLWSPHWTLQRLDPVRGTLVASRSAERRVALQEQLQQWWLKSTPSFPASTLGL